MRSLGGRTVPDGAVGILPAFMMAVAGRRKVKISGNPASTRSHATLI